MEQAKDIMRAWEESIEAESQESLKQHLYDERNTCMRCSIVERITDDEFLMEVALHDNDWKVRWSATNCIKDEEVLRELGRKTWDYTVTTVVLSRVKNQDYAAEIIINAKDESAGKVGLEEAISDDRQDLLKRIAVESKIRGVQREALKRITHEEFLELFVRQHKKDSLSAAAMQNIKSQTFRRDVALRNSPKRGYRYRVRLAALDGITNEAFAARIVMNERSYDNVKNYFESQDEDRYLLPSICERALRKIKSQWLLKEIVFCARAPRRAREEALWKIDDLEILDEIIARFSERDPNGLGHIAERAKEELSIQTKQ